MTDIERDTTEEQFNALPPELYDQDAEPESWENDVKIRGGRSSFRSPAAQPVERSKPDESPKSRAQQRLDAILREAEDDLREARDLIIPALEDLSLIMSVQHPNLAVLLGQQIEQIIQFGATSSKVSR